MLSRISWDYELIFVNDGSQDQTPLLLDQIARKDSKVRVIHLSRNFGHEAAMIAGLKRGAQIFEYAPSKAKMAICGNGAASKEQVSLIVQRTLGIKIASKYLDATDALALAMCHFYQLSSPLAGARGSTSWEKFVASNPERIKK